MKLDTMTFATSKAIIQRLKNPVGDPQGLGAMVRALYLRMEIDRRRELNRWQAELFKRATNKLTGVKS